MAKRKDQFGMCWNEKKNWLREEKKSFNFVDVKVSWIDKGWKFTNCQLFKQRWYRKSFK